MSGAMSRIRESVKRVASQTCDCQVYRDYLIRWSIFTIDKPDSRVWVEKDGAFICWANSVDEAKKKIDEVIS